MTEFQVIVGVMCALIAVILGAYKFAADKAQRIYERFDDYKKNIEGRIERTCVVKDMCALMHTTSNENIRRLEEQMKTGFDKIYLKIDELQKK